MSVRYFPIKTDTACQLKWTWSTVRLYTGVSSSCHRVQGNSIDKDNFDSFHNTSKQLEDRKLMLAGQWPTGGCEYCKKIEDAGGASDRLFHLDIPGLSPPELDTDLDAVVVTPRIVEIYFDNTCNLSCLYCSDGSSSRIQQENVRHGKFEKHGVIIKNTATKVTDIDSLTEKFWSWMSQHHQQLRRLHVLGGEPLFQPQFETCLDFLTNNPSPELEFNVISNLMINDAKFEYYICRIKELVDNKKIKRFDLTASLDCWGAEQEYVRHGLDLNQWLRNFEHAIKQPWITLNVNQTITGLTIKTMPEFLRYLGDLQSSRKIGHYFGTVVKSHDFLHPGIFGGDFFDADFSLIFDLMPNQTWDQKHSRNQMAGIHQEIRAWSRSQQKINQLGVFLDEMDRRRKTNWKQVFPWLEKEVQNVV